MFHFPQVRGVHRGLSVVEERLILGRGGQVPSPTWFIDITDSSRSLTLLQLQLAISSVMLEQKESELYVQPVFCPA